MRRLRNAASELADGRRLVDVAKIAEWVTAVLATIAFTLAILHLGDVTTSRRDAARDSCHLLRGLVTASTSHSPKDRAAANAYVHRTPLRNCNGYARHLVP